MRTDICRTAGVIAAELSVPLHRVQYVLRTRQHIQPIGRAGRLRIYPSKAVAQVRYELNRIDAAKATEGGSDVA